ncbi:MAG: hypothetical protein M1814_000810 [Vezdaea aestivalis]|nr:MAG: hypothetical protein M1814_000810 [Vezdaea aestivalis]
MPKAEAGSTKALSNKLKSKGLQRLRWYCQACERQMRDENGFKCHTQSESHVRQMLLVGEDPRKFIQDFSNQFQKDFLLQLRTAHGEKTILMNHFYQEYIANKEHVHMNSTKWPSLTEFAKFLGREGICRVEDTDKGLQIAWIDNSPDALRRQNAIRKRERQDKGDEELEQKLIRDQIARARDQVARTRADASAAAPSEENDRVEPSSLQRQEDGAIKLNLFGNQIVGTKAPEESTVNREAELDLPGGDHDSSESPNNKSSEGIVQPAKISFGGLSKPKNVFSGIGKKNALSSKQRNRADGEQKRPMSEAERIMKDELERKRTRDFPKPSGQVAKKQRVQ